MNQTYDVVIVGGGVAGAAVGYGIAKRGHRVALIDESPEFSRASRANTGLVWCQSKGVGKPAYSWWSFVSAKRYGEFTEELRRVSGIGTFYGNTGGIHPVLGEKGFETRVAYIEKMKKQNRDNYFPVTMLDRKELEKKLPKVPWGPEVSGGSFCEEEGWVDPLHLLYSLRHGFTASGGVLLAGRRATRIIPSGGEYLVETDKGNVSGGKIVLAAGLGAMKLGAQLGCEIPVAPNGGHKILVERVPDILPIPLHNFLRTAGGTLMFGVEHEHSWTNTETDATALARCAANALPFWPSLAKARVIRTWNALRVWPNDGFPIYDTLPGHDNVYFFAMHSAVTQAAMLQQEGAEFVLGKPLPEWAPDFGLKRFRTEGRA